MVPKIVENHPKKQKGNASITGDYAGTEEITLSAKTWQGQMYTSPSLGRSGNWVGGYAQVSGLKKQPKLES